MLAQNPQVLSLFEFFNGLDAGLRFSTAPIDGKHFADLLSCEQPIVTAFVSRGYTVPEVIYPFGPRARYKRGDPLPWILVAALPRLSDDPDALFDEVMAFATALPKQHLTRHYRQLFDWLMQRMGREMWIERSGSSVELLGPLNEFFPNARFLHIHRDGPEAALSMREHPAFRLAIALIYQLPVKEGEPDPISGMLESRQPVECYGRYWTDQLIRGFRDLKRLNADQYLEVRFEDLIATPAQVLRRISAFFALDPDRDAWIQRAAALVRGTPPLRFGTLSKDEQERLKQACSVGSQLLERGG